MGSNLDRQDECFNLLYIYGVEDRPRNRNMLDSICIRLPELYNLETQHPAVCPKLLRVCRGPTYKRYICIITCLVCDMFEIYSM